MITKVVLLEGANDLSFIRWLISKANIVVPEGVKLVQIGGKPQVKPYVLDKIIGRSYDRRNDVSYEDAGITHILLIKDYDLDDRENEFADLINEVLQNYNINMSKYYISGKDNPPRLLESLFIENDGEFLRSYARKIKDFNLQRKNNSQAFFSKMNDKLIFHSYQKLHNASPEYNDRAFDSMFGSSFLELQDIQKLIDRIKRFIEE